MWMVNTYRASLHTQVDGSENEDQVMGISILSRAGNHQQVTLNLDLKTLCSC